MRRHGRRDARQRLRLGLVGLDAGGITPGCCSDSLGDALTAQGITCKSVLLARRWCLCSLSGSVNRCWLTSCPIGARHDGAGFGCFPAAWLELRAENRGQCDDGACLVGYSGSPRDSAVFVGRSRLACDVGLAGQHCELIKCAFGVAHAFTLTPA